MRNHQPLQCMIMAQNKFKFKDLRFSKETNIFRFRVAFIGDIVLCLSMEYKLKEVDCMRSCKNNLSIIFAEAAVNTNHIKQARYCLQVADIAVYTKLREASAKRDSIVTPMEWL